MKTLFCVVAVALLALGCGPQIDLEKEKADLLQADLDFAKKSMESTAGEAFAAYMTEDALQLPNEREPVEGVQAIVDGFAGFDTLYYLDWKPEMAEVAALGDLGYAWGRYTVMTRDSAMTPVASGKYLSIWRKQPDGKWKVIVDMGNSDPPPVKPEEKE